MNEINSTFPKAGVRIIDDLVFNFDDLVDCSQLRPRFLGCSTLRDQIENMTDKVEASAPPATMAATGRTLEAFKAKMDLIADLSKAKNKAAKDKRQAESILKRQDMRRMLIRAKRYLGMAKKNDDESSIPDFNALSITSLDITHTAPLPFDSDAIFIAVDVEAFEYPPHPITEIGVAVLDTRDLRNHAPGTNGGDWQKHIRAQHFLVSEHKNKVNQKWVAGCPDKFEFNHRESTIIPDAQVANAVSDCFKPPYCSKSPSMKDTLEKRNVILVGHDINQDINYLRRLGISLTNFTCIIDTIDTAALFRAYNQDPNTRSLGHICAEFDLLAWHLHNAGNDAVYTLWAMLAICVKHSTEEGSEEAAEKREVKFKEKTETAIEQAKEKVKEESEGWEAMGDDGGVPITPGEMVEKQAESKKAKGVLYTMGGNVLDV